MTPKRTWMTVVLVTLLVAGAATAENTAMPTYVSTPNGWMHTENEYIPGVAHAELGWFTKKTECIKAQAIAARTYVLRWLNAYGHSKTIPALGPSFQAWTSKYSSSSKASAQAVAGQVMTYKDYVIYSNYASGAWPLNSSGWPYAPSRYKYSSSLSWTDIRNLYLGRKSGKVSYATWKATITSKNAWAWTYILNTNNEGKKGSAVTPTIHASTGTRNRGGLGQYRAFYLDNNKGYSYQRILRAFYGEDIRIVGAKGGGDPDPDPGPGKPDLIATSVSTVNQHGDDVYLGMAHTVTFRSTVKNQGTGAIDNSKAIGVAYYVGSTKVGWGIVWANVAPGASINLGQDSGQWVPTEVGSYTLKAHADDVNRWSESNEGNNWRSITRTVSQPFSVTASALNVRSGPSTGYGKIGLLHFNDLVMARKRSGSWYEIDFKGGVTGWCHGGYLRATGGVTVVRITANVLNVRTGPSTGYSKIGTGHKDQMFVRKSTSGGWHRIFWGGTTAWCSGTSAGYSVTLPF